MGCRAFPCSSPGELLGGALDTWGHGVEEEEALLTDGFDLVRASQANEYIACHAWIGLSGRELCHERFEM